MKIIRWNDNQIKSHSDREFEHVVELALWHDCGITEYIGITGASKNELIDLLNGEVDKLCAWMDSEVESGAMDERTDEPQIARILERPAPDEGGDFPALHEWSVFFDWN